MIIADQPTCLPLTVLAKVSSRSDGTVLDRTSSIHSAEAVANRVRFCELNDVSYDNVVYQRIEYGKTQQYDKIIEVGEDSTTRYVADVAADALFTRTKQVGLLLPVADCVATVVYDQRQGFIALVHLGRHSTLAHLARKVIDYFVSEGSAASDITIWMSPSAKRETYKLAWFDAASDPDWQGFVDVRGGEFYLDLPGYNRAQFIQAGVSSDAIHVSPTDTMNNPDYFSHQSGDVAGRIAVLAMMK